VDKIGKMAQHTLNAMNPFVR